ncbi:MAG: caspase family protein [Caldisericaceae bacterium]|nr:caspase family protein [Caldisericaceae bacterium]RLD19244.1 MAG: caspase family protein [Caldisericota bacterium]
MKKQNFLGTVVLASCLIVLLMFASISYAANPNEPTKPNPLKPVQAVNIELVKKISVKGPGAAPIRPPGRDKKGKSKSTATGILGTEATGTRFAIIIGISDYPGTANDLQFCDDDARDMKDALISSYGFLEGNIQTFIDEEGAETVNATRTNILNAIRELQDKAQANDEIVFFFSGHGMKGFADDGDKERVDESIVVHDGTEIVPIWDGELRDAFAEFATLRINFIFDSCLAGGMKKDLEAEGRVIAMASTESGFSYELSALENGEFTYYFAEEGILEGQANIHDYDNDGLLNEINQVTVEEAFDYAVANCDNDKPTIGDYFENDLLP